MGEATNRPEDHRTGIQLKIKRASANLGEKHEKGVNERMVLFKKRLTMLGEAEEWGWEK